MNKIKILLIVLVVLLSGCSLFNKQKELDRVNFSKELKLSELSSYKGAEYSGMCWYKENLVLLPQYPSVYRESQGKDIIFMIDKVTLNNATKKKSKLTITPKQIEVVDNQTYKLLPGYEGFEAICYDGEYFYLTIEFNATTNQSAVVKAILNEEETKLTILNDEFYIVDLPAKVFNASYESIFTDDNYLYLVYEANGKRINKNPIIKKIAKDFSLEENITLEAIEYRITDVTEFNENGEGWAINYFWPGNLESYKPEEDTIENDYAEINNIEQGIERIIPLKLNEDNMSVDKTREVVYIKRNPANYSSNWEGLVKYKKGFLIATDKFPQTVLKYIIK